MTEPPEGIVNTGADKVPDIINRAMIFFADQSNDTEDPLAYLDSLQNEFTPEEWNIVQRLSVADLLANVSISQIVYMVSKRMTPQPIPRPGTRRAQP